MENNVTVFLGWFYVPVRCYCTVGRYIYSFCNTSVTKCRKDLLSNKFPQHFLFVQFTLEKKSVDILPLRLIFFLTTIHDFMHCICVQIIFGLHCILLCLICGKVFWHVEKF